MILFTGSLRNGSWLTTLCATLALDATISTLHSVIIKQDFQAPNARWKQEYIPTYRGKLLRLFVLDLLKFWKFINLFLDSKFEFLHLLFSLFHPTFTKISWFVWAICRAIWIQVCNYNFIIYKGEILYQFLLV